MVHPEQYEVELKFVENKKIKCAFCKSSNTNPTSKSMINIPIGLFHQRKINTKGACHLGCLFLSHGKNDVVNWWLHFISRKSYCQF